MKNPSSKTFLFAIVIFFVISCRKIDKTENKLDYPAALVINGESNSISVINIETDEVVETCEFKKGSWPHHIYSNTAKDKLVVSLVGTDLSGGHAGHGTAPASYLAVLRASDFKVLAWLKTEHTAHNAIFMHGDAEVWMPQMTDAGTVLRLDAESLKETSSISVGVGPLEITKDVNETYAFVCNGDGNSVSVLNGETGALVKTIMVGTEPVGAWPASNNKMYVDCEVSKEVYEIDVTTLTITDTINLGFTPAYVSYNSLTTELWVSDAQNGGIQTYELISGQWTELSFLATGSNTHAIAFNQNQTKAYVTNQASGTVSVINAETFVVLKTITVGTKPNGILILE